MEKRPVVLCIMDGLGLRKGHDHNAVFEANTPNLCSLMKEYPFVEGQASGLFVGLPDGQMGNSEVGHMNMGAGRIIYQELTRISKAIEDGDFFENKALLAAVDNAKKNNSALHLMGLVSSGGVHSHNTHIYGLLELAKRNGLKEVYVHAFLDGRDTPPTSGKEFVAELEKDMAKIGVGKVASVMGRFYAMDRDNRWDRVEAAYSIMTKGGNLKKSATEGIQESYDEGKNDEFVVPFSVDNDGAKTIKDKDSVIFFNFRPDRAREMTRVFCVDDFDGFNRGKRLDTTFVCFTDYDESIGNKLVAFEKEEIKDTFGEFIAEHGMKQVRIAETEKYAHVTFFFDGGIDKEIEGAKRDLINSPKVATYDLQPEMSAYEVKDKLIEELDKDEFDVVIVNFANCDMVGHTGIIPAAIKAVSVVDECVGEVYEKVSSLGGTMLITADHGNAERLLDEEGNPFTAHTTNVVPLILTNTHLALKDGGKLGDLAPTMLDLLGLPIPSEMDGESLILNNENCLV